MKKKYLITGIALITGWACTFFSSQEPSSKESIKKFYISRFDALTSGIQRLSVAVRNNEPEKNLQALFLNARLEYKQIEFILEYYHQLDVSKINGPAIDFVEEEDPLAVYEPQGFQKIESYLYPRYNTATSEELLLYIDKLFKLAEGLRMNAVSFEPDEYIPDAAMEELYRILALGITGFDSPVAHLSIYEAMSSLNSVRVVIESYRKELGAAGIVDPEKAIGLIQRASSYLRDNVQFDSFNRMEFITTYLNPLSDWLGNAKIKMGYRDKPGRYGLIKKTANLFATSSLQRHRYLYDDTITKARIQLGRKLFFEPGLSKNGKRSCASCHQPSRAFTDGLPKANELDEHTSLLRNTPTLWNAALQRNLFYDSRKTILDQLITEVLANEKEMNTGSELAALNLKNRRQYIKLYDAAYPSSKKDTMEGSRVVNAIAMYLRTIVTYNSRFDEYMRGKRSAMKPDEIKGFNLFTGKALCGTCHYVPLFNGSKPPSYYYQESEVIGVPLTTDTLNPEIDTDMGRYNVVKKEFLKYSFKTPTLRNIALTAPYMHNGVFKTLEEVLTFYNNGGGTGLHINLPNQTLPFESLHLTATEQKNIIAFLKTLTDTSLLKLE